MKRKISDSFIEWKNSEERKPLILNGARQVGKTYSLEQFGVEYLWKNINRIMQSAFQKRISDLKTI